MGTKPRPHKLKQASSSSNLTPAHPRFVSAYLKLSRSLSWLTFKHIFMGLLSDRGLWEDQETLAYLENQARTVCRAQRWEQEEGFIHGYLQFWESLVLYELFVLFSGSQR